MSFETARRFYLLKRRQAHLLSDHALEGVWAAKQSEQSGTDLATDFPSRVKLVAAGYTAREDVLGATTEELQQVGLSAREAAAVLAALQG